MRRVRAAENRQSTMRKRFRHFWHKHFLAVPIESLLIFLSFAPTMRGLSNCREEHSAETTLLCCETFHDRILLAFMSRANWRSGENWIKISRSGNIFFARGNWRNWYGWETGSFVTQRRRRTGKKEKQKSVNFNGWGWIDGWMDHRAGRCAFRSLFSLRLRFGICFLSASS